MILIRNSHRLHPRSVQPLFGVPTQSSSLTTTAEEQGGAPPPASCDRSQDKIDFEFLGKDKTIVQTNYYTTVNHLHGLISPVPQGTPLPLVLLGKVGELGRLSASMKKLEKELKNSDKHKNEQYRAELKKSNDRSLALVKAAMDIVVAFGLLQLAPKKVTPHVTGGFRFVSSLISCYQLLPAPAKSKFLLEVELVWVLVAADLVRVQMVRVQCRSA
ncbi:hypothetical protein EZV62_010487 [Acer yangbiense]|uniref:Uncharacterized protein n=1 Tax=Acer yangbiense TaxID=1000413 RepID=A0A5C7I1W9_9ROSI|nr:hypothetical protein EZV62_010487 [Acer yangbiense]